MEDLLVMEKRSQTRYRTHFKARLKGDHGEGPALITNLSLSGLQLECDQQLIATLIPNINRPDPRSPIHIQVHFQVPTSRQSRADVDLMCLIIYTRRKAQDRYLLGVQFSRFEHHCDQDLQDYLQTFGEKASN